MLIEEKNDRIFKDTCNIMDIFRNYLLLALYLIKEELNDDRRP